MRKDHSWCETMRYRTKAEADRHQEVMAECDHYLQEWIDNSLRTPWILMLTPRHLIPIEISKLKLRLLYQEGIFKDRDASRKKRKQSALSPNKFERVRLDYKGRLSFFTPPDVVSLLSEVFLKLIRFCFELISKVQSTVHALADFPLFPTRAPPHLSLKVLRN